VTGLTLDGIIETCLYVDDLDAAQRFYGELLGLTLHDRQEGRHLFFRCGHQMLLLFDPSESALGGMLPPHGCRGAGHVAFAVSKNQVAVWKQRLIDLQIAVEAVHDWGDRGTSVYFRDPAGNSLEITTPGIWQD